MKTFLRTTAGALALALAIGVQAQAAETETVVMVDAPDVQKITKSDVGFRTSDVIGMDVYSNSGKKLGEIDDFMLDRTGHLYAVVDVHNGPLDGLIDLNGDDNIVVPWDQLRVSSVPKE